MVKEFDVMFSASFCVEFGKGGGGLFCFCQISLESIRTFFRR